MCFPTCQAVPPIINFEFVSTVFASLKRSCLQTGEKARKLYIQPLASDGLGARIPGFHPGHPGSISG